MHQRGERGPSQLQAGEVGHHDDQVRPVPPQVGETLPVADLDDAGQPAPGGSPDQALGQGGDAEVPEVQRGERLALGIVKAGEADLEVGQHDAAARPGDMIGQTPQAHAQGPEQGEGQQPQEAKEPYDDPARPMAGMEECRLQGSLSP